MQTETASSNIIGYVIMLDKGMSGWGKALGRSYYALEIHALSEIDTVLGNADARPEMRNARFVKALPRVRPQDNISIGDRECTARWYTPGGFR